ncbi:MAG TPA: hypothetical protein PKI89_06885 [Tepidiformaceae bacterium]|nr:hypothetical protein [Tepidiformaceae bacterium]HNO65742.1 hypothetical protein [Tepidiformaceae bacterium]
MDGLLSRDIAGRLAGAAAAVDGVRTATVCSSEGAVLGSAGVEDPAREAALGSFLALRAEALPVDGDLRGMGKQLAGSRFSHLSIAGDHDEMLLYALSGGAYLSVQLAPGRGVMAAPQLSALARRVAAMQSTARSS